MIFNFSQAYGEAVELPGRFPAEAFVVYGIGVVLLVGSLICLKIDGPGLISNGLSGLSFLFMIGGFFTYLVTNNAYHNFVAYSDDKHYLRSGLPENYGDLITGDMVALDLASLNVPQSKECVLSLNTNKAIGPGSIVYINKSEGGAIAVVNEDASRATELDYLVRNNDKFYNRTEKLAEFDLPKYVSCDSMKGSNLSDF